MRLFFPSVSFCFIPSVAWEEKFLAWFAERSLILADRWYLLETQLGVYWRLLRVLKDYISKLEAHTWGCFLICIVPSVLWEEAFWSEVFAHPGWWLKPFWDTMNRTLAGTLKVSEISKVQNVHGWFIKHERAWGQTFNSKEWLNIRTT